MISAVMANCRRVKMYEYNAGNGQGVERYASARVERSFVINRFVSFCV